jgi:CRP/FNR family transcriptional regulator, cyclic AMP receptor protein
MRLALLRRFSGTCSRTLPEDFATPARSSPRESLRRPQGVSVEQLRAIPALAAYEKEDLELLAYISILRPFAAGEVLMKEGTAGDTCWLVVRGSVRVTRAARAEPLATLGPGALVGQLALLDRAPRSATVAATENALTLEVRAAAFANLVRASSPIALRFQQQVALAGVRQLREATRRLGDQSPRTSLPPASVRELDDWDDGSAIDGGPSLELAVDPRSIRR